MLNVRPTLVRLIVVITIQLSCQANANATSSINTMLEVRAQRPNVYKGYPVPTRESLLANSPLRSYALRRRRLDRPYADNCGRQLFHMKDGFWATYPEATRGPGGLASWAIHIAMIHFPHLYLCSLRHRINESLTTIRKNELPVAPLPQRINVGTFDFTAYDRTPNSVRQLQGVAMDLIWMSYRGFRPAMLELLKLADRSPIVRLTTRFKFYLLQCAIDADLKDPLIDDLLPKLTRVLPDPELEELRARAKTRRWPLSERMVID